jgi:hypothetical protein
MNNKRKKKERSFTGIIVERTSIRFSGKRDKVELNLNDF